MKAHAAHPTISASQLTKLAHLLDLPTRTRFLASHPQLHHSAIVEQIAETVRERVRIDVHEAEALSEAAVVLAEMVGTDEAKARALRAKANAHWFLNDLRTAVDLFHQAADLFTACGDQAELGRTLSSSIQSLILVGEYTEGLDAASRARAIFLELGDDRRLARLDINVANILHRQDRLEEALTAYERAYERLLPYHDTEAIGVALHNMSVCLILLNDLERALTMHRKTREHCERAGMPLLVAQADYNIANLYFQRGNYSRALDMLRTARINCEKVGDRYHAALCELDKSDIYLELNLTAEAVETAQDAQAVFEALGNGYETARALTNLAIAAGQQKEAFRALELFAQARQRFEQEQNAVWPSVIDLYQSLVLCEAGRFLEARRLCTAALASFQTAGLHRKSILCELVLARIALHTGDIACALDHCGRASSEAESTEAPVLDYQAYFLKGQIEEAAGDTSAAYDSYQAARARLEALRSVLWGEDLKIAFMTNKLVVYERLVDLCLAGPDTAPRAEEIFGYMEQAKSRTLRDVFAERVHPIQSDEEGQSELVRQIRTLREQLNWYYHRVEAAQLGREDRSPVRLERLHSELREREQMFIKVLREMPAGVRQSAGFHDTTPITLEELRPVLGSDTSLIEYFATGDRILAAVVTSHGLTIVPATTTTRVRNVLRLLQFQLSKFQYGPEYITTVDNELLLQATREHLQELHEELVAPLHIDGSRRLVIVPHGLLHYVPFHALFDGRSYLSESMAVSYAPSASIYVLCRQRMPSNSDRALVMGVPDTQAPFILHEIQAVADALPDADLFVGDEATVGVLRERGANSRIVHIATHGYFRGDNPMFSGVRLGDSYLALHDLYGLRLPADLVTLSGCGTGLHVVAAGDELRSLVRGLLAAGARSVLVTLWNVDDRSAADFMACFYRRLQDGAETAIAVQQAIADLRHRRPHPYYWAPFVLVGADRPAESIVASESLVFSD